MALHHLARARRFRRAPAATSNVNAGVARFPRSAVPITTYIICTNPRSGSWLLSEGLASTSLAGNPREWFNTGEEQQHRARWRMEHSSDLSYATYIELVRAKSTTSNGISGIKLHYYQFVELPQKLSVFEDLRGLTPTQLIPRAFPNARYIWLTRRDKVRQAISLQIASSTGEWWTIEGATPNGSEDKSGDCELDLQKIAHMERGLEKNDSQWRSFFEENNIVPFVVHYEELAVNYAGTIVSVLKWLGVPNADTIVVPPTRLRRQSNARNDEWLKRYTAFKSEGGHLAQTSESEGAGGFGSERAPKPLEVISSAWKQWIGQSKLLNGKDDLIVEVLTNNGYSRASALAEVEKAASDSYLVGGARIQQRLQKGISLLNALGQLARLDSSMKTIERRSNLSRDEFRDRYYAANRPVIMEGLMTNWRAMTVWKPNYLKSVAGDQVVEIMAGRDADPKCEINARKHRMTVRFADYVDMVYSEKTTNDYYLVANNGFFQLPSMRPFLQDFTIFPQYLKPVSAGQQCFLWFGPPGTITPLHHDTSNILIAQVVGRKRYRLIPPSQWECVYNNEGVFSDVDCENPDLRSYPKFRNATIIDVVVGPGEVLFMPVGWWHHVRALDVSMTVSFTNFVFPNYFTWEL